MGGNNAGTSGVTCSPGFWKSPRIKTYAGVAFSCCNITIVVGTALVALATMVTMMEVLRTVLAVVGAIVEVMMVMLAMVMITIATTNKMVTLAQTLTKYLQGWETS